MAARKKKRKKIKYREVSFRLTARQKKSLQNYCSARKTTPTKLIKKMIRPYISQYADSVPDEYYITEKQLDLFSDNGDVNKD